jgi:hypothetical protein
MRTSRSEGGAAGTPWEKEEDCGCVDGLVFEKAVLVVVAVVGGFAGIMEKKTAQCEIRSRAHHSESFQPVCGG